MPPPPGGMKPFRGGKRGSKKAKEKRELAALNPTEKENLEKFREGVTTRRRRLADDSDLEKFLPGAKRMNGVSKPENSTDEEVVPDTKDDSTKVPYFSPFLRVWGFFLGVLGFSPLFIYSLISPPFFPLSPLFSSHNLL